MSYQAYLENLPKKRMGAGCVFLDSEGRLLIVKPIYREVWLLPGGVVEADESPRQACIREVKEEIGFLCQPERLLCVSYINSARNHGESLQFVFWGGVIAEQDVELGDDELSAYQFLPPDEALPLMGEYAKRRISWCLKALKTDQMFYLENDDKV